MIMIINTIFLIQIAVTILFSILAAFYDIKSSIVPNKLNFSLLFFGIVSNLILSVITNNIKYILASFISMLITYVITYMMWKLNIWGGGDVKLFTAIVGSEIGRFFRVGAPLALQDILTNVTFLAICAFVNRLGLEASSGYGVSQRIVGFVMLIPSAIIQSMSSFVAQNVGAGDEKRAKQAMKCGMLIGGIIGVPVALMAFFGGDMLSMVFTKDAAVIGRSAEFLRGFAIEAVVTSILFSFLGYFNDHSRSTFVMVQGLIQSLVIRLLVSYLMSIRENATLTGIGIAAPSATILGIIMCSAYYIYVNKKIKV